LYGALELFTNNRKRNQIVLLHNIIFSIKKEFNREFDKIMAHRQSSVDQLNDKNKRIEEILSELRKDRDIFEAKKNILENAEEKIMKVDGAKEIPFEKFLTREERKRIEEEKRKEEERLKALMSDDAGIRAVKQMMSGTLEERKENPLDEGLEREEWMNKPTDEMTEEERLKFKEFEVKRQRLEEEKEKIRKNLENELKKLRSDVSEIC
jgi:chromosome segregation ATPase